MKGSNCDSNPEYKGVPLDSIDGIINVLQQANLIILAELKVRE